MRVIGVTGGIGAGKSTILSHMEKVYKARTLEADKSAHLLMWPGKPCFEQIVTEFGTDILMDDGMIDRARLARIVFSNDMKLRRLNSIVHPAVRKYISKQVNLEEENGREFFVLEAALLVECGYITLCDDMWYVYASEQTRIERLIKSRGYKEDYIRRVFAQQMTEDEFRAGCTYVINNDCDEAKAIELVDKRIAMLRDAAFHPNRECLRNR